MAKEPFKSLPNPSEETLQDQTGGGAKHPDNGDTSNAASPKNIFDPANLRLSQNFGASTGVEKLITTVPVRKPNRQDFVRAHPSADYQLVTAVLELKVEREMYLVAPELWPTLASEVTPKVLITTINRQGVLSLWPIRMPGEDGRLDEWNASALEAADLAQNHWIRLSANMSLGAYEIFQASGDLPAPKWPDLTFDKILDIAFKDHKIDNLDHPVLRRLRGEV